MFIARYRIRENVMVEEESEKLTERRFHVNYAMWLLVNFFNQ